MDNEELIYRLPKSEVHIHLGGVFSYEILSSLLNKYGHNNILVRYTRICHMRKVQATDKIINFLCDVKCTEENFEKLMCYTNFDDFINIFRFCSAIIYDIDDMELIIKECIKNLISINVIYAEVTVTITDYLRNGICLRDIVKLLVKYKKQEALTINWIADLGWSINSDYSFYLLKKVCDIDQSCFCGITLGGKQKVHKVDEFVNVYNFARNKDFLLSVHAGEVGTVEEMWYIVNHLKPNRIGHGIQAVNDENLLTYLEENKISLEICMTSNIKTRVVNSYNKHPVFELLKKRIPITINSDDPFFFNTSIYKEYLIMYRLGVGIDMIYKLIKDSFLLSWLPEQSKNSYIELLDKTYKALTLKTNHIRC